MLVCSDCFLTVVNDATFGIEIKVTLMKEHACEVCSMFKMVQHVHGDYTQSSIINVQVKIIYIATRCQLSVSIINKFSEFDQ